MSAIGWVLLLCLAPTFSGGASAEGWSEFRKDGLLLYFQEADRSLAGVLLGDLVAGRAVVARKLGGDAGARMTVYLAPSQEVFGRLTGGRIPHWGAACAFPEEGIVVLRKLPGRGRELLRTARHEMAHVLLHRAAAGPVPVWFDEGVAMWAAREWRLRQSAEVLYAVLSGGLIPLEDIDSVLQFSSQRAHLAYTESLLAVTHLIHLAGPDAVAGMVSDLAAGIPFNAALYRQTGLTPHRFERSWADYVGGRFSLRSLMMAPEAFWFYLTLLFLAAYVAVRLRNRRVLRRWEGEDPADALPLRLRLRVHSRKEKP